MYFYAFNFLSLLLMRFHFVVVIFVFYIVNFGDCRWGRLSDLVGKVKDIVGKAEEHVKPGGRLHERIKQGVQTILEEAKTFGPKVEKTLNNFMNPECWNLEIYTLDIESCEFHADFRGECKVFRTDCTLRKVVGGGKCSIGKSADFLRTAADIEVSISQVSFAKAKVSECTNEELKKEVEFCESNFESAPEITIKDLNGAKTTEFVMNMALKTGFVDLLSRKATEVLEKKMCSLIDDKFFQDQGSAFVDLIQVNLATTAINRALESRSNLQGEIRIPLNLKTFGYTTNVADLYLKQLHSQIRLRTGYFGMRDKMIQSHMELDQIEIKGIATIGGYIAHLSLIFKDLEMSTVVDASFKPYATNCYFSLSDVEIAADLQWENRNLVTTSLLKATQYILGAIKVDNLVTSYIQSILEGNVCQYFENEVRDILETRLQPILETDEL